VSFFSELKRRNVFRVGAAYAVTAWLLIEVSATLEETLRLPEWADSLLAMFLILGFPVALFFSWAYEITPEGIKSEKELAADRSIRAVTARKLDRGILVVMALALGYFAVDKFLLETDTGTDAEHVAGEHAPLTAAEPAAVGVPELSIAVLPFVNMSFEPEQEYFSDGLTEELLNLLADIRELKVAARTSSFYYKNKTQDIPITEIGRQLGVAHLLEGSVRKDGNRIRVTAQLIKADDGFHVWSETWDRELENIFDIQDEIAAAVVDQLKVSLLGEAPKAKVIDMESWELTQRARFLWKRRGEGDWQKAFELFKRAIELDDKNADAWLGAAPLHWYVQDPPDADAALRALKKAMELDPSNAEARARYAIYLDWINQPEEASIEIQRALAIDPDDSFTLATVALFAGRHGDRDKQLEYLRRAVAADPLYVLNLGGLANALRVRGEIDEAEQYAQKILEIDPDNPTGLSALIRVRLAQGRADEALALALRLPDRPVEDSGGILQWQLAAIAYHAMGDRERSDAVLERYIREYGEEFPLDIAQIHALRGDTDLAFEWIQRGIKRNPTGFRHMIVDSDFDGLRVDPRWAALVAKLEAD